ncbi:MAG: iron-containing alcohol dehydrogenase, partial [Spirochaetales bacterium]|nr:iron-containing alcohol dehydrogenase [Spirochaetales bacterium]
MRELFCQSYLNSYSDDGTLRCQCGREHRLGTRKILLGEGVIEEMAGLLAEFYGPAARVWVLSDENTEAAAGLRCKENLSRFRLSSTVLPASPRPRTTEQIISRLAREAAESSPELILAVGSGTISDVGKMVSLELDVPNWCVATAPSVDAYSSGTSAIKLEHGHKTEPARPTELIFNDLSVLEKAPEMLFLSGVGDLLAKYLSYLDWKISAWVNGEYICEQTARLCLDSARQALSAVSKLSADKTAAVRSLTDAILVSGLAMQALVNSRPASSAEHTVAHSWEIAGSVGRAELELHGLLVGLACRILLEGYREFYEGSAIRDFDIQDRLRSLGGEPGWDQMLTAEIEHLHAQIEEEMGGLQIGETVYRSRLEKISEHRKMITDLAAGILGELKQAVSILADIGYPFRLSDYSLDPQEA